MDPHYHFQTLSLPSSFKTVSSFEAYHHAAVICQIPSHPAPRHSPMTSDLPPCLHLGDLNINGNGLSITMTSEFLDLPDPTFFLLPPQAPSPKVIHHHQSLNQLQNFYLAPITDHHLPSLLLIHSGINALTIL